MNRRKFISSSGAGAAAAAVSLAAVVLLAGCGGPTDAKTATTGSDRGGAGKPAAGDITTGLTRWEPAERARMPRLRGRTLVADRFDVSDWRGHVVVVNTWGSWCGPCREETPNLRRVAAETRADGVRFVGIDTRDNDAAARAFVREFAISYPSLVDDDDRLMLAFGRTIPVSAVPTTVVVDARGRIAARVIGAVTYITLRGLVDDTVAEANNTKPPAPTSGAW
jgi:thiol-disulfide isomerase/thioredoxin